MNINTKILESLKTMSLSANHPKVWIASALVYKNTIISYGVNQMKSHPFQYKYGKNKESIFLHAEISAIHTADKKLRFEKFTNSYLYIARMKWDSTNKIKMVQGLAKPCSGCMSCIQEYGIKGIVYTLDHIENVKNNFGVIEL